MEVAKLTLVPIGGDEGPAAMEIRRARPRRPSIVRAMSDLPRRAIPGRAADRSVEDFDESYLGTPPWDIGSPQPVFAALVERAKFGRVLDAGCGTGEHTLMVAARSLSYGYRRIAQGHRDRQA